MRKALLALAMLTAFLALPARADTPFVPYHSAKFEDLIATGRPVVVHVHADWCPTCRRQLPLLDEILSRPEFASVAAVRVNYDRDTDFRRAHRVNAQSTVIVFKKGREVARSIGDTTMRPLEELIGRAL
jgi:thiol-disulfide isomerase/thioredoxin